MVFGSCSSIRCSAIPRSTRTQRENRRVEFANAQQEISDTVALRVAHSCGHVFTYPVPAWMSGTGRRRMVVRLSTANCPECIAKRDALASIVMPNLTA